MKKRVFRKGQWVICRYLGDNGDLIAGRVDSVRNGGKVLLTNLLTGSQSVKRADVLNRRNQIVTKSVVDKVVKTFKAKGKKAARTLAVQLTKEPTAMPAKSTSKAADVISAFNALSHRDRIRVLRAIWDTIPELFRGIRK